MRRVLSRVSLPRIIRWTARISGTIVLLIPIVALTQIIWGERVFNTDWRNIVLYSSLILGLSLAFKKEHLGGAITTIGVVVSGFMHPLILMPGVLYMLSSITNQKLPTHE
jgi:hypothetical protein